MTDWEILARELDAWHEARIQPTFWWRDDDAVKSTSSLQRLLALSEKHNVPVSLSVIPWHAHRSLQRLLAGRPSVSVLQHGYSHRDHSPPGEPPCELSAQRLVGETLKEIKKGRRKLQDLFPDQELAVLVPPWGRINEELFLALVQAGFVGVSTGEQNDREFVPGLRRVDVHIDIVQWRARAAGFTAMLTKAAGLIGLAHPTSRGFVGLSSALDQVLDHLSRRRTGAVDIAEPTGLMTHHLAHDERCWNFIDRFLTRTCAHPSVRWMSAEELFDDQG